MSKTALLSLQNVRRSFLIKGGVLGRVLGKVHAVDGISLEVRSGETLGLVGESGCGKSTLGRIAVGLLPPDSGEVLFQGKPLQEQDRGHLQMIFQDPFSSLNPRMRIGKSIAEPLLPKKLSAQERQERMQEMLARVGLDAEYAKRYPHEFSGGQRQRIAIARALVTRPELVVCDEAVSALDASVQAQVLNLLLDARESFGLSYLFISHNLGVVGYMSDRVAVMYLGQIVEMASCGELFQGAGHPYTKSLLAATPEAHKSRHLLSGEPPSPLHPPTGCAFHPRCQYALPRCREEKPSLHSVASGHFIACHLF